MTTSICRLILPCVLGAAGGCGLFADGGLSERDTKAAAPYSPGSTIDPPAYVAPNYASITPIAPIDLPITDARAPQVQNPDPPLSSASDAFATMSAGLTTGQPTTIPAPLAQPPESTFNVYGSVMANAMTAGPGVSGLSLSQISFAQEGADFDPDVSRRKGPTLTPTSRATGGRSSSPARSTARPRTSTSRAWRVAS